jgi:peptide/nickel transport system permease protein
MSSPAPNDPARTPSLGRPAAGPRRNSPFWNTVRRIRRHRGAVVGFWMLVVIIVAAVLAPWIAPYDPLRMTSGASLRPPSATHWFGTDQFGRDIFSRVLFGARISLTIGFASVGIAMFVGGFLGLVAGYFEGILGTLIMRVIDAMLAFPGILLALAIVATLGPGIVNVMIAVGISWIPSYTRVVRASVLSAKQNVYVEAAQAAGASSFRVILKHVVPNVFAPVIVLASLGLAGAIIAAAALSFLGMGAQPPTPEWGLILSQGRSFLRTAWWISTFPGLVIMVTVFAINLLGDGLQDALNPRLTNA